MESLVSHKQSFVDTLVINVNFDSDNFEKFDGLNRKLITEKEKLEQDKKILSKSKDKSNFEKFRTNMD